MCHFSDVKLGTQKDKKGSVMIHGHCHGKVDKK